MEKSKLVIIIGIILACALPIVYLIDKHNNQSDKVYVDEDSDQSAVFDQERIKQERKKELDALSVKLTMLLRNEWVWSTIVESNGSVVITDEEIKHYNFHITGVEIGLVGSNVIVRGAINYTGYDLHKDINELKLSKNPTIYPLLERFKKLVTDDLLD